MARAADYGAERARMVERQIAQRGITDPRVLAALASVPREAFVSQELTSFAYDDAPLPIGDGQTISQPYIVARTAEALQHYLKGRATPTPRELAAKAVVLLEPDEFLGFEAWPSLVLPPRR